MVAIWQKQGFGKKEDNETVTIYNRAKGPKSCSLCKLEPRAYRLQITDRLNRKASNAREFLKLNLYNFQFLLFLSI